MNDYIRLLRAEATALVDQAEAISAAWKGVAKAETNKAALFTAELILRSQAAAKLSAALALEAEEKVNG